MSSMLEQAIIDADELKETAKQTAEEAIVEKYQDEIKEAIEKILEQDELTEEGEPVESEEVKDLVEELPSAQMGEMDEVVEIDLNKLEEMMAEELEEGELDAADMLEREEVAEEIDALTEEEEVELDEDMLAELTDEEVDITEENIAALVAEILSEDTGADLGMGPNAENEEAKEETAEALEEVEELEEDKAEKEALEEDEAEKKAQETDNPRDKYAGAGGGGGPTRWRKDKPMSKRPFQESLQKENKSLLKEQKRTERKVQLLKEKVDKYGTVIKQLKDKLNESNLTNAKLLYQNRILNSVSLNERQKDKIVEAISNATTVEEAKLIFETLQSAVGVSKRKHKRPESLNEVVTRSSSAFYPRKEVKPSTDVFSDRMKRLAGLK